jgi:hypothetical protein
MMMTFKEFVEKFNEAVPDPKYLKNQVAKYEKDPEIQQYANDPNKMKQKIIEKEIKRKKDFNNLKLDLRLLQDLLDL